MDRVIAAMPSGHPYLTTQKSFYVAISRARDRAELVTDDAIRLAKHLETATGERVAALDAVRDMRPDVTAGVDESPELGDERERDRRGGDVRVHDTERKGERSLGSDRETRRDIAPEPMPKAIEMDLDL